MHRALQHRARAVVAVLVLALAALGLAACGGSNGGGGSSDARSLLQQTFANFHEIKSGKASLQLTVDAHGDPALRQPIRLTANGPFQSAGKGQIPKFDVVLNITAQGQSIEAGLTSTSDRVFVQFGGSAYEVPANLLAQLRQSLRQSGQSSKGKLSFGGIGIKPINWLKDPKVTGNETLDGVETQHITAQLDVNAFLNDVDKLLAAVKRRGGLPGASAAQIPDRIPEKTRKQIEQAIKDSQVDVWTGERDKTLRKLTIAVTVEPKDAGKGPKRADVNFSLELRDLNQPQTVQAPTNVKPLSDLLGQLGGLLGGGFGAPSGGGSGGGASSEQINKYSQCLRAAGSDVKKAQECAKLLTK